MNSMEKINALDLIIHILQEHETKLSSLIGRLEDLCQELQQYTSLHKYTPDLGTNLGEPEHELEMRSMSILVVDDDETVVNLFKAILQEEGYHVETAITGKQAIKKIKETEYDLVILDFKLPDLMGDEVARKIRKQDDKIGIIMITGYPAYKYRINELDLGVDDVILKPIENDELIYITNNAFRALSFRDLN